MYMSPPSRLFCQADPHHVNPGTVPAGMLPQQPDATFKFQPSVSMRCYDSLPPELWQGAPSPALPSFAPLRSVSGVRDYCHHRFTPNMWPACPPVLAPTSKADIFFGVLTAQKLLGSRARVASRVFALQGARHGLFGEVALNNASGVVTLLPESAQLELGHGRLPGSTSAGRTPYIAQKVLEMLVAMHSHPSARRARWFVVCDDDSFVFVDRLSRLFSSLNETEPLLVGAASTVASNAAVAATRPPPPRRPPLLPPHPALDRVCRRWQRPGPPLRRGVVQLHPFQGAARPRADRRAPRRRSEPPPNWALHAH